jgi:shikimate kinase
MKIFLIGFMGCGKSVFGKRLAAQLGLHFEDLDNLIESKYKMSIPGIFSQFDEPIFRELETRTLMSVIENDNFVLACGGGTPCFNHNMDIINDNGISIYIKLSDKSLAERLIKSKAKRPLLANTIPEELLNKINKMLSEREAFYNKAKIVVDGLNLKTEDVICQLK